MDTEVSGTGLPLWLVISVVIVALVVGTSMIGVVLGKYAISKWFHPLGGPMLSFLGVVLIGLSVFGNVKLKVGEFEGELNRLQAKVEAVEGELVAKRNELSIAMSQLAEYRAHTASASEPRRIPSRKAATKAYFEEFEGCMELPKGQREFCFLEAHSGYKESMGW